MKFFLYIITLFYLSDTCLGESKFGENQGDSEGPKELAELVAPTFFTLFSTLLGEEGVLNDLYPRQIYKIPLLEPFLRPKWKKIANGIKDLSAKGNDVFVISRDQKIYQLNSAKKFKGLFGRAKQLSINGENKLCAVGTSNEILVFDHLKRELERVSGMAKYIDCMDEENIVIIHTDADAIRWGRPLGILSFKSSEKWMTLPGEGLIKMSVRKMNDMWGLKENNSVWYFNGHNWKRMPGLMIDISIGEDGTVMGIGENKGAYIFDGYKWIEVYGTNLKKIIVVKNGLYYAIDEDDGLWISDSKR